ncbi:PREDICTED: uncharacterized protein LOC105361858 isoform X2 [Ceratosolen solmsi marchali]|uniref:Uncharacterized protein LOC105361858 isoform X2 n=1 Tax=Ceratosolen solmsi marchali TaxID=326594 RepID=A0AAJ6YG48_9HYME|nr:PREDICTED: uncharacterized protein LOC105361858 isoform X2 [Ceratosolen solmsi marchali]
MGYYPKCCSLLMSFLLVIAYFQASLQLAIKKVNIPEGVKVGEEYVILDCDYDLGNTSTKGLVVKWYLNNFDLVYQWIYGSAPQAIDPASKYIDLHYKASHDPNTMYRAMKLKQPDIDLSGNYTCLISTFEDETSAKRPMTVYSTGREDEFKLWHTKKIISDIDESIEVTCQAVGLYPKPTLDIIIEDYSDFKSPRPIITETEDGHYNIVTYLTLDNDDLPDSVVINCILGIPNVNYNATKKLVHYTAGRPTTLTAIAIGGTTKLLRKMEIQALDISQADASNGNSAEQKRINFYLMLLTAAIFIYID